MNNAFAESEKKWLTEIASLKKRELAIDEELRQAQHKLRLEETENSESEKRERELHMRIESVLDQLRCVEAQRFEREKEAAANLSACLLQVEREKAAQALAYSEQLHVLQTEHAHRERALDQQLQIEQQRSRRSEQELNALGNQLHAVHQQCRRIEQEQKDMQRQFEAQLQNERESGQKQQLISGNLRDEIAALRKTLSWRLTAPLRTLHGWFRSFVPLTSGTSKSTALGLATFEHPSDVASTVAFSEEASMNSGQPRQAKKLDRLSSAPNLATLLQYSGHQFVECA
ncbi:MAG TPA: hypothetical protein VM260_12795, partial [Pirellula sp.]|nr:hypothetical protein [Pirellula sp.]